MSMRQEYMTVTELRKALGIGKALMARLIKEGIVKTEDNPFDKRIKLVKREDADALLNDARAKRKGVLVAA